MRKTMRWQVWNATQKIRDTYACVEDDGDLRLRLRQVAAREGKPAGKLLDEIIQANFGNELFALIAQWKAERFYFREAAYYLPEALAAYSRQRLLSDGKGMCKLVAEAVEAYLRGEYVREVRT